MNKLNMKSKDIVSGNVEKLAELFPSVVKETNEGLQIDFDLLKQELTGDLVEPYSEIYGLNWPGKRKAQQNAGGRTTKTLRPLKEKSVDFDNTENIYIEGDNLEVLKILQNSYSNKVNIIYIDPPYNTGNDFIYNDDFRRDKKAELKESRQIDDHGNVFTTNKSTSGRFHSDWLSMMYPRLKLASNLLSDDGVIFISIDDNEFSNLKKIADEIFGENNFICAFIWKKTENIKMDSKYVSINKDYILAYKKRNLMSFNKQLSTTERYNLNDEKGKYYLRRLDGKNGYTKSLDYVIEHEGEKYYPGGSKEKWELRQLEGGASKDPRWLWSFKKFEKGLLENDIVFKNNFVYNKVRYDGIAKKPFTDFIKTVSGQTAQKELNEIFDDIRVFDHPKPPQLIKFLINLHPNNKEAIILDFFSGSATTAHAVMQLNAEDHGNRKYIMVQLDELTPDSSEAYKEGYRFITDLGQERIRKAAKKLKEETEENIDYGFRVFKVDSSNMKDTYYTPNKTLQEELIIDVIKEDRSDLDIITQIVLDELLLLDFKIEEKTIRENKVYYIENNSMIVCLEENIDGDFISELLKSNPHKLIFKETAFRYDSDKINLSEKIKQHNLSNEKSYIQTEVRYL